MIIDAGNTNKKVSFVIVFFNLNDHLIGTFEVNIV